jgi:hypothetical protein
MSQTSLAAELERELTDYLIALEAQGRPAVEQRFQNALNPSSSEASALWSEGEQRVRTRATAMAAHGLYPWSHPFLSSLAFESVVAASVQCWLMAGPPDSPTTLKPSVQDFIRWQVKTFTAAIGADRTAATA